MKRIGLIIGFIFCAVISYGQQIHSGGINIATGFKLSDPQPIDDRYVVQDSLSLLSIPNTYTGLWAYSLDDSSVFVYDGLKWERIVDVELARTLISADTNTLNEVLAKGGSITADREIVSANRDLGFMSFDEFVIDANSVTMDVNDSVLVKVNGKGVSVKEDSVEINVRTRYKDAYTFVNNRDLPDAGWVKDKLNYVNIEWFGAIGDSITDNTLAVTQAIAKARQENKFIYIPKGRFNIVSDTTIHITGIAGIVGTGNIHVSSYTPDLNHVVFMDSGSIKLIQSDIAVQKGNQQLNLSSGLDLKSGDVVFMISTENIGGYIRNGNKGQRLTVSSYNNTTGVTVFSENFDFDINHAYLYKNDYRPHILFEGVTLSAPDSAVLRGFYFYFDDVVIRNCEFYNFGYNAINIINSHAVIDNIKVSGGYYTGSPTSYCVQVSDLSVAYLDKVDLRDGRHSLSGGGVGSFNNNQAGGIDSLMFLPAKYYVSNSRFSNTIGTGEPTIDSHGCVGEVSVINSIVYGGIGIGGMKATFTNCTIYNYSIIAGIYLGRDRIDTTYSYGYYAFNHCDFFTDRSLVYVIGGIDSLILNDVTVNETNISSTREMIRYFAGCNVKSFTVNKLNHYSNNAKDFYTFRAATDFKISNSFFSPAAININALKDSLNVEVDNVKVNSAYSNGLLIATINSSDKWSDILISNVKFIKNAVYGAYIIRGRNLNIKNSEIKDNVGYGIRAIDVDNIVISDNTISGATTNAAIRIEGGSGGLTNYSLNNNDLRNNTALLQTTGTVTHTGSFGNLTSSGQSVLSKITLGSDATGDMYYRNSSGNFTRLGIGATGTQLRVTGGVPAWANERIAATISGNGTTTVTYTLPSSSTWATVTPSNSAAGDAGVKYVTVSGTTLTINTVNATASGTDNLSYNIEYK